MQAGLRLQILVGLGGLLALAFVPLFFAIAAYTEVVISRSSTAAAQRLADTSAVWLAQHAGADAMPQLPGVEAWGSYDGAGRLKARGGHPEALPELWPGAGAVVDRGQAVLGVAQTDRGRFLTRVAVAPSPGLPRGRLLGFYMALVACALLVGVYFLITTFIIRPLDEFTRAAQHVASATHGLQLPRARARELSLLAGALSTMTERLARDQADLQRKVHELEQARAQLEQTQAHLVRSERLASVGQLAAGLAHEIGNPLAALSGMQELMLEGGLEPEQQVDFLKRMRSETERISRIIRDLLDFARPTPLEGPQEADLEAVIAETVALVSHQPLLRKVQLALDVHPQLPRVKLGPAALTQVLLNLLLNAARACVDGGQVRVTANAWGDGARLVVEDEGQGVPPELRERIFEPFFSTREVGQGTGLGLSVCRGLVEAAGGRVWVEDAVPHGARFVVELRAADKRL